MGLALTERTANSILNRSKDGVLCKAVFKSALERLPFIDYSLWCNTGAKYGMYLNFYSMDIVSENSNLIMKQRKDIEALYFGYYEQEDGTFTGFVLADKKLTELEIINKFKTGELTSEINCKVLFG